MPSLFHALAEDQSVKGLEQPPLVCAIPANRPRSSQTMSRFNGSLLMLHNFAIPIEIPPSEKYVFAFHIANLTYNIDFARNLFGPSPFQDFVDGLGDADYWAFQYPCGMKLLYEFIHPLGPKMAGYANVFGDIPEFEHGRRHIPFAKDTIEISTVDTNKLEMAHCKVTEPWATKMATLDSFQVWRQGDDGNVMSVGGPRLLVANL